MEKRRRRSFTDEFKAKAVHLVSSSGRSLTDSPSFHLRQGSARSSAEGFRFALVMQHRDLHPVAWRV